MVTTTALNAKVTEIKNKIPDTSHFINTQKFNGSTKVSFDTRMKEAKKTLARKTEINNALDLGDKKDRKK